MKYHVWNILLLYIFNDFKRKLFKQRLLATRLVKIENNKTRKIYPGLKCNIQTLLCLQCHALAWSLHFLKKYDVFFGVFCFCFFHFWEEKFISNYLPAGIGNFPDDIIHKERGKTQTIQCCFPSTLCKLQILYGVMGLRQRWFRLLPDVLSNAG